MPTRKRNADGRRQIKAARVQLFVKATGRKKRRGGLDPNDRPVESRITKVVRRMDAQQFDQLLRDGED